MSDIKGLYNKLQDEVNSLSNQKIALGSEISTVDGDLKEKVDELLEKVGKKTLKEAVEYVNSLTEEYEGKKEELEKDLKKYIKSVKSGEIENDISEGDE